MKIVAIFTFVVLLFIWNRFYLLLVWAAISPIISNLIQIYQDNPFFGSIRIVDYVGYAFGPAKRLIELLDFDRIVLVLLFLAAVNNFRRPTNVQALRFQRWLAIFASAVFISALYSNNVLNALRKATDTAGLSLLAFWIGMLYLDNTRARNHFLMAILLLGGILGGICIIEYSKFGEWGLRTFGDVYRVSGPFRYWETLGMTLSLVVFIVWFKWITAAGSRLRCKKLAYLGITLVIAYCIFRTQTRTIMVALALGIVWLLYKASGQVINKTIFKKFIIAISLATALLFIAPEFLTSTRFYQNTLTRQETGEGRKETYAAAVRMFLNNPLLGIGLKNFQDNMKHYVSAREFVYSSEERSSCHSSYLVTAAECGLMGFVPLLFLVGSAFLMCTRYAECSVLFEDKAWAYAMLGMTITYFLCGLTFDPFFDPTMQNQLYYMCLGGTVARMEAVDNPKASLTT